MGIVHSITPDWKEVQTRMRFQMKEDERGHIKFLSQISIFFPLRHGTHLDFAQNSPIHLYYIPKMSHLICGLERGPDPNEVSNERGRMGPVRVYLGSQIFFRYDMAAILTLRKICIFTNITYLQ
jgi:hypothetical protein